MESEKLSDSEVLERLIYKAFVSPDKFLPRDTGDALLAFAIRRFQLERGRRLCLRP